MIEHFRIRPVAVGLAIAAAAGFTAVPAAAQDQAPAPNQGDVGLSLGFDVTSAYFFRGIIQEDQGFIIQPWAELEFALGTGDGPFQDTALVLGIWNSFHDEQTGADADGAGPDSWYEADLYVGLSTSLAENLSGGVMYIAYTSPNDAFATVQEIDVSLGYDDSEFWGGDFALNPSATIAFEIDNTAFGTDEGIYLQLLVEPSVVLLESETTPVTLTVPVMVGISLDDYYEAAGDDDQFGFVEAGLDLSVPLTFMPERLGTWEAGAGVHFLFLGDNLEAANGGDDLEVIGKVGLAMSY